MTMDTKPKAGKATVDPDCARAWDGADGDAAEFVGLVLAFDGSKHPAQGGRADADGTPSQRSGTLRIGCKVAEMAHEHIGDPAFWKRIARMAEDIGAKAQMPRDPLRLEIALMKHRIRREKLSAGAVHQMILALPWLRHAGKRQVERIMEEMGVSGFGKSGRPRNPDKPHRRCRS